MSYRRLKFKFIFLFSLLLLSVFLSGEVSAAETTLSAKYKGGDFDGKTPSGGLTANSTIRLSAYFSGEPNICEGNLNYKLFRTLAHAKGGERNQLEYLAKGEGDVSFDYDFNSGTYGQENEYKAVFYCWSANTPETALRSGGAAQKWESAWFEETTAGGACTFANAKWSKNTAAVGEEIEMSVEGKTEGCKGLKWEFEIWNAGFTGRKADSVAAEFPASGNLPLTVTKTWSPTEEIKYYFKIRLPGGVNNCAREGGGSSKDNCVKSGTLAVSGEADGDGGEDGDDNAILEFRNPLQAEDLRELIDAILIWIFWLSIPSGVIMILYAGLTMMTAAGNPEKFDKGKKILLWTVIGLVIVFIGEGFVTLIESILDLGK